MHSVHLIWNRWFLLGKNPWNWKKFANFLEIVAEAWLSLRKENWKISKPIVTNSLFFKKRFGFEYSTVNFWLFLPFLAILTNMKFPAKIQLQAATVILTVFENLAFILIGRIWKRWHLVSNFRNSATPHYSLDWQSPVQLLFSWSVVQNQTWDFTLQYSLRSPRGQW